MFAIFAEDKSDFETLKKIVKKIAGNQSLQVKGRGFDGGSELLKDGARSIKALSKIPNIRKFIVCHDADSCCNKQKLDEVVSKVIKPSGINASQIIAVVPTAELESWILADVNACRHVFRSMPLQSEIKNPESIKNAKEHLARLCRERTIPKYSNATHNPIIADYLDLQKVYRKCPSFRVLAESVDKVTGIQRPPNFWRV